MDSYIYLILLVAGINLVAALGLHVIWGMTGMFSFGHAAFISIGAYVSVILNMQYDVPFYLSMIIATIVSGIAGFLVSIPTTKLKGDYLALVTIGFGEIVRVVFLNLDVTGGALGIAGIPGKTNGYNVSFCIILGLLIIYLLNKSWFGKGLVAIRENEHAATVMGINVSMYKRLSFAIGAAFAGCSGVLYAFFIAFISPGDFGLARSIEILLFIIIGGLGFVRGAVIGTVIMTALPEVLRFVDDYRTIFYGVLLIVLMIYRPDGIIGALRPKKTSLAKEGSE